MVITILSCFHRRLECPPFHLSTDTHKDKFNRLNSPLFLNSTCLPIQDSNHLHHYISNLIISELRLTDPRQISLIVLEIRKDRITQEEETVLLGSCWISFLIEIFYRPSSLSDEHQNNKGDLDSLLARIVTKLPSIASQLSQMITTTSATPSTDPEFWLPFVQPDNQRDTEGGLENEDRRRSPSTVINSMPSNKCW